MAAIDDLKSFRRILIADRGKAATEGIKPGADVAQWAQALKTLQEQIEAVDHAIADAHAGERTAARWDDPKE